MKNLITRFFKRRKIFIYRKLQLTYIITSFSYVVFFYAIMATFLFVPLIIELDKSDIGSDTAFVAAVQILYLHEKFWPALLLCFFAIACHSIFISHKIAGPLHRFNFSFKAIQEGIVPPPIQLRSGDYLYREMENINQMLEGLRDKLTELQEIQAQLNRSIIKCKKAADHSSRNELIKSIEDLTDQGKILEEKLGYFKVVSQSIT